MKLLEVKDLVSNFSIPGTFLESIPYGSGHINDTFLAKFQEPDGVHKYIFQRINTSIFKKSDELMSNIARVLDFMTMKLAGQPDLERRVMRLIPTTDGQTSYSTVNGRVWRVYAFIEHTISCDILETAEQAYQAARAFGEFMGILADFPAPRLFETIPHFHDTPSRYADFDKAVAADVCGRAASVKAEIDTVNGYRSMAGVIVNAMKNGEIPERITHNDTKLNNVLLDEKTNKAVCVIDLDTVMPGSALYDFGDLVRTSCNAGAEDEPDLSKIYARKEMFVPLAQGFLDGSAGTLTKREIELLPFAGMLITLETGVRFLTDHLNGDTYFKIHRPNHNLDRARTQFKLVASLKSMENELNDIVKGFCK